MAEPLDFSAFARELSDLCRKHGVGISNATIFMLEPHHGPVLCDLPPAATEAREIKTEGV